MRSHTLAAALLTLFLVSIPQTTYAQNYRNYYQPRVYNSPPPQYSRNTYVTGGRIIGGIGAGVAGTYYGGPYGGRVAGPIGGAAGGYIAGRQYDYQMRNMQQNYYYPRAYGIQTTTPYYIRTIPRY